MFRKYLDKEKVSWNGSDGSIRTGTIIDADYDHRYNCVVYLIKRDDGSYSTVREHDIINPNKEV